MDAVLNAHPSDEKHFLEWKTALELGPQAREGHFTIAKCVLAMANRPVAVAANYFGGCGYMTIGATPAGLEDVAVPDMADLEPQIQRYIGNDGPVWSGHTVQVHGSTVLVIIVEPPRDGDPIFPLMKTFAPDDKKKAFDAGTIFVRDQARSKPATPADIKALEKRLIAGREGPQFISDITVESSMPDAIQAIQWDDDVVSLAVAAERNALTLPAERPTRGKGFPMVPSFDGPSPELIHEYSQNRDTYLREYQKALPNYVLHNALQRLERRLRLVVKNDSQHPLHDVRVKLHLPAGVAAFEEAVDVPASLPRRPMPPASSMPITLLAGLIPSGADFRAPELGLMQRNVLVSTDRKEVTFTINSVHPEESVETDSFILVAPQSDTKPESVEGCTFQATLSITAGNRSGVLEGAVVFQMASSVWTFAELAQR